MNPILKTAIIIILIFELGLISFIIYDKQQQSKEYKYCGFIITKGYEQPTSGYKANRDAVYYVIMKENVSGKAIRVNVNVPTFYSLDAGSNTCFTLSNMSLYKCGNTQNSSKNLFNK